MVDNAVSMITSMNRFLAFLSALAIAACIFVYIYSFWGAPADKVLPWGILLIPGWMLLLAPIYALEYPASRTATFALKGFARGMPSWVAPCSWVLSVIAIFNFVWFAMHAGLGVPAIMDGQYVLDSRGRILKVLTQADYLALKEAELRTLATVMIYFFFVPMTYWWYRRNHQQAD